MKLPRLNLLKTAAAALALLLFPAAEALGAMPLEQIAEQFSNANTGASHVCVTTDNWQIAFISHNKEQVGAVIIIETEPDAEHEYNLTETASRIAELISLASPVMQQMENSEQASAIMIDTDIMEALADEASHVFSGSPLEGMAYLLQDGYFYIDNIRPNGWLHWKTVKKSQVELLMPMAPAKLTALEMIGRQRMDDYASEVLARKLGLGSNTASEQTRKTVSIQMDCSHVPYMNTKRNFVGAYLNKRYAIGKRNSVSHLLGNRYGSVILFPSLHSKWPGEEEPVVEEVKEVKPLTPREARDAYIDYLRSLAS